MYGWHYQGMGGGWWIVMMIAMVLFWTLLVFGIVALVRHNRPTSPHTSTSSTSSTSSAIAILQERFARGELTEEEYNRRRAILKDPS